MNLNPLRNQHTINIITEHTEAYDTKRFNEIHPGDVKTLSFSSREARKAYLEGLAYGLENKRARLLTLKDAI